MSDERELSPKEWQRRKFIAFGALGLFGAGVWGVRQWIVGAHEVDGAKAPLRSALEFNERVNSAIKSDAHLVKEFPKEMATRKVRVNGRYGVTGAIDLVNWKLMVVCDNPRPGTVLAISMEQLHALPKTEIVYDFKCIEGWSQISHWGGVRFRDFAAHFGFGTKSGAAPSSEKPEDLYTYTSLRTANGEYYVGIDMPSALHPQTILAYEMNGEPLPMDHGAPLRLIIPTKYGVKNLKRIGIMGFSDERPRDYWHERGYDYDCAL
jgi:DMSO/TMAO reductase YedYZ molybdopterin-dependent catalytic subunit